MRDPRRKMVHVLSDGAWVGWERRVAGWDIVCAGARGVPRAPPRVVWGGVC